MGFGDFIGGIGTALHLPELGISEMLGGSTGKGLGPNTAQSGDRMINGQLYNYAGDPIDGSGNVIKRTAAPNTPYTETGGGGGNPDAAYYQDTIAQLNSLLGNIGAQRDQGLARLNSSAQTAQQRLDEDRKRAMLGYDTQGQQNDTQKLRGTEQVDSFANNSFNNLQRILQGANAGQSSVGRELVPQLVSKAAGTRRQGVFNTYGENQQEIDQARNDATTQFDRSNYDLGEQKKRSEEDFLRGIGQNESDIYSQLAQAQIGAAGGNRGAGAAARAAAAAKDAQLQQLFGNYQPSLSPTAVNLKTPTLGSYSVDPTATAQTNAGTPAENAYYLPALKKKQAGL